jgi:hypothetical protein
MIIEQRILQSLRPRRDGILLRSDADKFGKPTQVTAALKELQKKGVIARIDRGVYAKTAFLLSFGIKTLRERAKRRLQESVRLRKLKTNRKLTPTARWVMALARREKVHYVPTFADQWATAVTRLADDTVVHDPIDDLLVALTRSGKLSAQELVRLATSHYREQKRA